MVIIRKITKAMWKKYVVKYFESNPSIHPESRHLYHSNVIDFMMNALGFVKNTHTWQLKGVEGEWTLQAGKGQNVN